MRKLLLILVLFGGIAGCASRGPIEINGERMTAEDAKLKITADGLSAFEQPVVIKVHRGATEQELLDIMQYLNRTGYDNIQTEAAW